MTTLYTVRPSPGEGLGCFATTTISPGDLILSETPLLSVPEPRSNAAVTTAFARLSLPQRTQYLSLHAQKTHASSAQDDDNYIIDIFNSNAWQTGSHTSLCPLAARFNHSCIPNASFAYNPREKKITVHAIISIPPGEQIRLSYERPYQRRLARQEKLAAAYGFTCTCPACYSSPSSSSSSASASASASDIRRARMILLDARIRTGRRQLWRAPQQPNAALELVRLLKEEGLVGEALGLAYHDAAVGWKRYGRLDLAVKCAQREVEVARMCFGTEAPAVDVSRGFLKGLEADRGVKREGGGGM